MTHSSHARRKDVIEARNYEVALSRMVAEQKERTALATLSGDLDLVQSEFTIGKKLEDYRRDLLDGTVNKTSADGHLIDTLVRSRIPACSCQPYNFRPGEYCADCGAYRADGDEF